MGEAPGPPTVFAQPKAFSIRLRCFRDRAQPSCRVVRPPVARQANAFLCREGMAEYHDFRATCRVTQACRRPETNSAASSPLSAPSGSHRVDPGEWRCTEPWCRHWSGAHGEGPVLRAVRHDRPLPPSRACKHAPQGSGQAQHAAERGPASGHPEQSGHALAAGSSDQWRNPPHPSAPSSGKQRPTLFSNPPHRQRPARQTSETAGYTNGPRG